MSRSAVVSPARSTSLKYCVRNTRSKSNKVNVIFAFQRQFSAPRLAKLWALTTPRGFHKFPRRNNIHEFPELSIHSVATMCSRFGVSTPGSVSLAMIKRAARPHARAAAYTRLSAHFPRYFRNAACSRNTETARDSLLRFRRAARDLALRHPALILRRGPMSARFIVARIFEDAVLSARGRQRTPANGNF